MYFDTVRRDAHRTQVYSKIYVHSIDLQFLDLEVIFMRPLFLTLVAFITFSFSVSAAYAESTINLADLPRHSLTNSPQSWMDYFAGSFSVAPRNNFDEHDLNRAAGIIFSLNKNLAISGDIIDTEYRTEKTPNTSVLLTLMVKSSF